MAKEVWCAAGNRMVTLPGEAFNQSLLAPSVTISPCNGCEHAGHLKRMKQIVMEMEDPVLPGLKRIAHTEHQVHVLRSNNKEHVQCTCNCYPQTVKED